MLLKSEISRIAGQQMEMIRSGEKGLSRDALNRLPALSKQAIIITGIRRCGKSTLLNQLLTGKYPEAFFLNFDDNRLYGFEPADYRRLDDLITESGKKILFFDEPQIIIGWERYVRQKLDENYRIIITGSNASLLSRELGTKLTGRHITGELFPFSFNEFCRYRSLDHGDQALSEYMTSGGFPEYLNTLNNEILLRLFDDILIRDIVVRFGIKDIKSLQRLALYLISNTGNTVTGSKLKQHAGISATSTIMEYFSHLELSYLFSFIPRFSFSVKAQMINPRKVYTADTGLITVNSISFTDDHGHKLENIVYNHLRLKYGGICYFLRKNECDFIASAKGQKPAAVQVCHSLNMDNLDRELNGLFEALGYLNLKSGIIVTFNQKDRFKHNGFSASVIPATEFLGTDN